MIPFLRRANPSTLEENPLWLVVLCDMMTNLMLFFLVMYSFTLQTPAKKAELARTFSAEELVENPRAPVDPRALEEFKERRATAALNALLRQGALADETEVSTTEDAIRVRLRNKVLFRFADASLTPDAAEPISRLAEILKTIPNEVVVEGHTDDVPVAGGPYRTNWELSVARSYSVIERLIAEGVDPHRLVASGYGDVRPVASNDNEEGRARNRRVEIVILRAPETKG